MSDAAITFEEGRFYVGLWYLELPNRLSKFGKGGNLLGVLWRPDESVEDWHFQYRFRHFADERLHDSADELHCYHLQPRGPEEKVRSGAEKALTIAAMIGGNLVLTYIEVRGDMEAVLEKIQGLPMFHGFTEEPT
jgi:hypothetical protein